MRAVQLLGPDLLGFIFYPRSPRFVGHSFRVADEVPESMRTGVFVDETLPEIMKRVREHRLAVVQLHGQEPAHLAAACRAEGLRVIKAIAVSNACDFGALDAFSGHLDFFLFDTAGPLRGGHGVPFDWGTLKGYTGPTPFLLSGGLRMELASQLKTFGHPQLAGYDLNSGVEVTPGVKSVSKTNHMIQFLKQMATDKT